MVLVGLAMYLRTGCSVPPSSDGALLVVFACPASYLCGTTSGRVQWHAPDDKDQPAANNAILATSILKQRAKQNGIPNVPGKGLDCVSVRLNTASTITPLDTSYKLA